MCRECGGPLPEGSAKQRRYCDACRAKRAADRTKKYEERNPEKTKQRYTEKNRRKNAERRLQYQGRSCADCGASIPDETHGGRKYCDECQKCEGRRAYRRDPETAIRRTQAWYWKNADAVRQKARERHAANRERNLELMKKWREQNKERHAQMIRQWQQLNREHLRLKGHEYRTRKRGNGGTTTKRDWHRLVRRYGGRCAYCRIAPATTADHVIPVSRGGTSYVGNLLPACKPCNSSKKDKTLMEWRISVRRRRSGSADMAA